MSEETTTPRKKGLLRRLLKWAVLGLVLLVIFVAAAPYAAGPLLRGTVVSQVEKQVHGRASLDSLSVAPLGRLAAQGFALQDASGRPVARVEKLEVQAKLMAALGGHYSARVDVDGFEVHAFQEEDGTWNVERLAKESAASEPEPDDDEAESPHLPNVSAYVRVANGLVVLHALDGTTEVRDLSFSLGLDHLDKPAKVAFGARIAGDGIEPGELSGQGDLTLAAGGVLGLDGLRGTFELSIVSLVLDALEPLLVVASPVRNLAGRLDGQIDLTFHGGLAIEGDVRLDAHDLDLVTETEAEDGSVATMELITSLFSTNLSAKSEGARFTFVGETSLDQLEVEHGTRGGPVVEDEEPSGIPARVKEPRLTIAFDASAVPEPASVDLTRLAFSSTLLSGEINGKLRDLREVQDGADAGLLVVEELHGDLRWIPDRIAALLGPMIPGQLSGADEEPVSFTVNGRARDFETSSLVEGFSAQANIGVGRYQNAGLDLSGAIQVVVEAGIATMTGDLGANGGSLDLESTIDLRHFAAAAAEGSDGAAAERRPTRFALRASGVRANSELSPLLGQLHPAFAGLEALKNGAIGGLINAQLELDYDGPLSAEELDGGWDAIPKAPFTGRGEIGIDQAVIAGSPFLSKALAQLGVDTSTDLRLSPLSFAVSNGRLTYDKPWAWNVSGSDTTFAGSVGLDQSMDLTWSVPLTEKLIGKSEFLQPLLGQTVRLPISGSLKAPRLEWSGVLSDLVRTALAETAKQKAKEELTKAIGDQLGEELGGKVGEVLEGGVGGVLEDLGKGKGLDLGGILGGKKDSSGSGSGGDSNDPAQILLQADQLWSDGKQQEAGVLYTRLRDKFKFTTVYLLNKSRIKDRAQ